MNAGQKDQLVRLQPRVDSADGAGQNNYTFGDGVEVWASVNPVRGKQYFAASQQQATVDCVITVDYRTDVDATWRVLWNGVPYGIVSPPIDPFGRHVDLELMCVQGVGDGAPRHGEVLP